MPQLPPGSADPAVAIHYKTRGFEFAQQNKTHVYAYDGGLNSPSGIKLMSMPMTGV